MIMHVSHDRDIHCPAVTDLDVLPHCEFTAVYAHPHKVTSLRGPSEVKPSKVHPKDETWYHNFKKADAGNALIAHEVSVMWKEFTSSTERLNLEIRRWWLVS